jgi:hypothetical protein
MYPEKALAAIKKLEVEVLHSAMSRLCSCSRTHRWMASWVNSIRFHGIPVLPTSAPFILSLFVINEGLSRS